MTERDYVTAVLENTLLKPKKEQYKKCKIKSLCVYSIITLLSVSGISVVAKSADARYIPFINEKVTYYSNDELTYSSLDASISRDEKEDCSFVNITKLEPNEQLKFYSEWEKVGNTWCRTVNNSNISEEEINTLENLVKENASSEELEDIISHINPSEDYVVETSEEEPNQKQGYFKFKMIDDTSYEVEPTFSKKIEDTLLFIFGNSLFTFVIGGLATATIHEEQRQIRKEIKELEKSI